MFVFISKLFLLLLGIAAAQESVPIPKPTDKFCKVNICFAFDESSSVLFHDSDAFLWEKSAALNIASKVGTGSYFVGVEYNTDVNTFVATPSYATFANAVNSNGLNGGGTDSEDGLKECAKRLHGRTGPKVIVLLTDGRDAHLYSVTSAASALKPEHTIITINVGPTLYDSALENVASHESFAVQHSLVDDLDVPFVTHICEPCCEPANICFAIDESGSISHSEFAEMMSGLTAVVSSHNAFSGGVSEYSAVQFGIGANLLIAPVDADTIITAFESNIHWSAGRTAIGDGIEECGAQLRSKPGLKIIVVLSDGYNNYGTPPIEAANSVVPPMRIISVGIGNSVDASTMSTIAAPNEYVAVNDFSSMLAAVGDITKAICNSRDKKIFEPVPAYPDTICADVTCAQCGSGILQCFPRTGSEIVDKQVCSTITRNRSFMSAARLCGVRSRLSKSTIQCFPQETFGLVTSTGDSATCRGDSRRMPKSFVTFKVCSKEGEVSSSYECSSKVCSARRESCWPLA